MTSNPSDYGTPQLAGHSSLILEETMRAGILRARNTDASALDRLYNRHRLDDSHRTATAMYDAGNRFSGDWRIMGAEPSVIAQYSDMIAGGGMSFAEAREDARKRHRAAIKSLSQSVVTVTLGVLCYDETTGRGRIKNLRIGLRELADHYGYLNLS